MFNFAEINHMNDIRHAISDDFYVAERDWGYVINYHISAFPEIKDAMSDEEKALEAIRREFRGIKFNRKGELIARPLHKFFNWGEKEAEMVHFDFNQPFTIMDKLDGSMIHPMWDEEGDIIWCTKMGPTEVADQARAFVKKKEAELYSVADPQLAPRYESFVETLLYSGWTPIFEWCSRQQRIVVDYPEDQLILIALRCNQNGHYMRFNNMIKVANDHNIPVVKTWPGTFDGIDQFVSDVGGEENCEGYVIRFQDGHMVKLKNAWYLNLHRAKDQLSNEKNVWRLVLDQHHDDLIPQLDDETRKALETFADQFLAVIREKATALDVEVQQAWDAAGHDRKTFAINFATKHEMPAVVFRVVDGATGMEALGSYLHAQTQTQTKIDAARHLVNGLNWRSFYYPVDMDG